MEKIFQRLRDLLEKRPEIGFAYLRGSFVDGPAYHDITAFSHYLPAYPEAVTT